MTLFSYVVRWDHGFAPNPFFGICTLATCKPDIRKKAKKGDWILGTGSSARDFGGRAIFLMQVSNIMGFNEYWGDPAFLRKRPVMNGSLKQRFGDNIYHREAGGAWIQADSRHSWDDRVNEANLRRDTGKTDRVLIGSKFTYWGEQAPMLPKRFQRFVIKRPGWAECQEEDPIASLLEWHKSTGDFGQLGNPVEWRHERWWR